MRAVIEAFGAIIGAPVSEGKGRGFRLTVLLAMIAALLALAFLTLG
jgi:hypothetical protein